MAFGFMPISGSAISDYPAPPKGIVLVAVTSVSATGAVATISGGAQIKHFLTGLEATGTIGLLDSILTDNSNRTVFLRSLSATTALGSVSPSGRTGSILFNGVTGNSQLGVVTAQGTFVAATGVEASCQLGLTTQQEEQAWMQIIPSTTPGWVEIIIHAQI